ncbi:PREDICTED: WD repeat-containing protein 34-like [Priapulus caudatus]|uniref:WD repeat-containing protein 34-like n=1 Tax=Priapulus caudatus TaxID=37621 RepID=A0ABM1DZ01_PRICU|nr:PREDICTED: WD repeat-containing protein 34-like [Priapulus caudatus]
MSLVTIPLEPHKGAVSSVATSPFSSKLLLTCSFDGTVKIFKLGQENTAVFSADPSLGYLHSAVWSYSKPLTFAVATGDGYVLIYDLSESQSSPLQKLKASPELQPVHHVTFNPSLHHTVASADKKGVVKVWQLSDSLTYNSPRALQSLNLLASSENSTKAETSMK